jgi:hypothetical protein
MEVDVLHGMVFLPQPLISRQIPNRLSAMS